MVMGWGEQPAPKYFAGSEPCPGLGGQDRLRLPFGRKPMWAVAQLDVGEAYRERQVRRWTAEEAVRVIQSGEGGAG